MSQFAAELAAARSAQELWGRLPVRDRVRRVRTLRGLLVDRTDAICTAVQADIARPPVEVIGTELLPTAAALKFLERRASGILAPRRVSWWDQPTWLLGSRDTVHRRPWGVVAILGTWNYPFYLNAVQIAHALVAGNAVLWKPSENAPRTATMTLELFRAARFPAELLQVLPATRAAGPQIVEAAVDHVVFTGSDATGRKLASRLGERLIPSTLELSGCDAMFVLEDANVCLAARAAWFGLALNRGQTCIAVRRIFVHGTRYEEFVAALAPLMREEPLGLVLDAQREQATRLVEDAVMRGAKVMVNTACEEGGVRVARSGSSSTLQPTILLKVAAEAAVCRESCFAPLAAVLPFDTIENALAVARQCLYGLSASIFSTDTARAKELACLIPAGSVVINDVLAPTAHPATPFGGRGASGWGVTQGAEGLIAMTVPQVVTLRAGTFRPHFDESAHPAPATVDVLRGLLIWTHARGLSAKFAGLRRLLKGIWRTGRFRSEESARETRPPRKGCD